MRRILIVSIVMVVLAAFASPAGWVGASAKTTLKVTLVNQNSEPYGMTLILRYPSGESKQSHAAPGQSTSLYGYDAAYFQKTRSYGYRATIMLDGQKEPLGSVVISLDNFYSIYPEVTQCYKQFQTGHILTETEISPVIRYECMATIYAPR